MSFASLRYALIVARSLNESGEPNEEYVRGQVTLIMDLFGIRTAGDSSYDTVTEVITSRLSLETSIAIINANNRRARELEERKKNA